jgi:hypothetical protein
LNMENGMEACSMLLGRSLLKQASNSSLLGWQYYYN